MGWGRTLLLGDIGNRLDIGDCEADLRRLRSEASRRRQRQAGIDQDQDERIDRLEADLGEAKLYLAALVRVLVAKGVTTTEEFGRLVDIVDTSDGAQDGRYEGFIA